MKRSIFVYLYNLANYQLTSGMFLNFQSPLCRHQQRRVSGTCSKRNITIESKLSLDTFVLVRERSVRDLLFDIKHIEAKYCTKRTICQKRRFYHCIAKAVGVETAIGSEQLLLICTGNCNEISQHVLILGDNAHTLIKWSFGFKTSLNYLHRRAEYEAVLL